MLGGILDVLFPPRCVGCAAGGWPFCGTCWRQVALLVPPGCRRCGRPLPTSVAVCSDCPPPGLAWCRAPFLYEGPVRRGLIRLKFGGMRSGARAFGPWMAWVMARSPPEWPEESGSAVATWVPLGRRRRRARGYDQALALAREVGRVTRIPVRPLLVREVETGPQARRSGAERRVAMHGAFRATGPAPPTVILVDDVLTSGATAAECARVLLAAGARRVGLLCAARSLGGPVPGRCYDPPVFRPGSVVARGRLPR